MSITSGIALFLAMALSAAIPGPSVLAVVSRSISHGWRQGLLVVFGVLIADYIFIFLALSGLTALASAMGDFATVIKYIGITYLFWLAYTTWTSSDDVSSVKTPEATRASSVIVGVLMTLSNPKAILFYMGFFSCLYRSPVILFARCGDYISHLNVFCWWVCWESMRVWHQRRVSFFKGKQLRLYSTRYRAAFWRHVGCYSQQSHEVMF